MATSGKRAGSRRAAPAPRKLDRGALLTCAAITLLVVAWGYLVYAAIDFGTAARGGAASAWGLMALASLGAIACLFAGLMLVARLMRQLGLSAGSSADVPEPEVQATPRPVGGKRAAR